MSGPSPGFTDIDRARSTYAAFSVLDPEYKQNEACRIVPGKLEKWKGNPLFRGDNEWEHDLNNAISSLLYDEKTGKYRLYYPAVDKGFQGNQTQLGVEFPPSSVLYAESDDGLKWTKPDLHVFKWNNLSANNIMFDGIEGIAIYDDGYHEKNASRRFKAWGDIFNVPDYNKHKLGFISQVVGTAVSADGITWTDYRRIQGQHDTDVMQGSYRPAATSSLYYDPKKDAYTVTQRAFRPCLDCGHCPIWWQHTGGCQNHIGDQCTEAQCNNTVRAIGLATSVDGNFETTQWNPNMKAMVNNDKRQQFYAQVTFPFYNIYLGIVSIFAAGDPVDTLGKDMVRCELSWSTDGENFELVAPGMDFIPLGETILKNGTIWHNDFDSHICFAASYPVQLEDEVRVYYMGGDGPHYSPAYGDPVHRNTSFGLGSIHPDGFVAVQGPGHIRTVPLEVTHPWAFITADATGGHIRVSVEHNNRTQRCWPIRNRAVNRQILRGCKLEKLIGQQVNLVMELSPSASLYTVGFRNFKE
eukprot:CAMPEP_0114496098 /NCGR_PEP_ID=MMETSP0109-20121206/5585_1 /TAXON_ID=29199 /ORGANISM="Chlorarachnion reptans, Strain CCCM449" /LENGTH=524 /DNA_ID=CAMNT_0001673341 /DNA_START=272 /DNA_END=1846 /DNA_ORIENTATION=-